MKLYLRDLFWFILIAAVVLAWWVDRSRFSRQQVMLQQLLPAETMEPVIFAWNKSNRKFPLRGIWYAEGGEISVRFGWGTRSVGAYENIGLKKVGNTWQVVEHYDHDL